MQRQVKMLADQMVTVLNEDASLREAMKADPAAALPELADKAEKERPIYTKDKAVYRIAVVFLGSLAALAAVGSIVLVLAGEETPEVLVAIGSAAVGALVGLFATSPTAQ